MLIFYENDYWINWDNCFWESVIVEMFIEREFEYLRFSDEIREEARKRGIFEERKNLQDLGNEMRKLYGNGYWAKRICEKIILERSYVIDGIRNLGEVDELRKMKNFILIGIDAPYEKRVERIISRERNLDPRRIEDIKKMDGRDRGIGEDSSGQQVMQCYNAADKYILNDRSVDDLKNKVKSLLESLVL